MTIDELVFIDDNFIVPRAENPDHTNEIVDIYIGNAITSHEVYQVPVKGIKINHDTGVVALVSNNTIQVVSGFDIFKFRFVDIK